MDGLFVLIAIVAAIVALDVASSLWGADSREADAQTWGRHDSATTWI